MKTMVLNGLIKRFSNSDAVLKESGGWKYVPKSEWKKDRVVEKKEIIEKEITEEKVTKSTKKLNKAKK